MQNPGLFLRELIKWSVSFSWSQQSKLVQKESLLEKCAKPVKYTNQRGNDVRHKSLAAKTNEAKIICLRKWIN